MNEVAREINELLNGTPMIEVDDISEETDEELKQYGVKRRSGRYPWGSGENPYQRTKDFLARYDEKVAAGLSEKEIADEFEMSTGDLRVAVRYAKHERKNYLAATARSLKEDGLNPSEIARKMGYANESSVRALLNENTQSRRDQAENAANALAEELKKKGLLDVGKGAEHSLGISEGKLEEALLILEMQGYNIYGVQTPQPTNPRQKTTVKVLCPPDVTEREAWQRANDIQSVGDFHSDDGGKTFRQRQYPASIDKSRVMINYADTGTGKEKDGLIEIRPGCEDLNLGQSHYAQVRILVDGTHYLKGMAVYNPDLPEGVDVRFNTSKTSDMPFDKVLKAVKTDQDNPFGAYIPADGQSTYTGKDGKEHLSAINKLKWEGDWEDMNKNLSSQFLSKQPKDLIEKQLNLTYADYDSRHAEIMSLNNPTIKRKMLIDLADSCDGAAIHLKAAALPRQRTQVLIPITEMKDNEVYAPNFRDGEHVVLIRYPHGGTFEIPELVVNNKNRAAQSILPKDSKDAVGINSKVAERLSGADFDGDQVVVIPVNYNVRVQTRAPLKELKDFDAKSQYAIPDGDTKTKRMTKDETQKQMGIVSNLISDMTLKGATDQELARAVKHSMVVIDAEKHGLDYKRSEKENGIDELKNKYQRRILADGTEHVGGASTLLSRRKQSVYVPERKGSGRINPETGKVEYKESGRKYYNKKGELVEAQTKVKLLSVTDDARTLSSGTTQENLYADYMNRVKALADQCRRETFEVGRLEYHPQAAKIYKEEVDSLKSKLEEAEKNAPIERQAIRIANSRVEAQLQANPELIKDKKTQKKMRQTAIEDARVQLGATSRRETAITITDKEWEAIQAGAISDNRLTTMLKYVNMDDLYKRALPRTSMQLSDAQVNKINAMLLSGYTNQEIADAMNISVSAVYEHNNRTKKE